MKMCYRRGDSREYHLLFFESPLQDIIKNDFMSVYDDLGYLMHFKISRVRVGIDICTLAMINYYAV